MVSRAPPVPDSYFNVVVEPGVPPEGDALEIHACTVVGHDSMDNEIFEP